MATVVQSRFDDKAEAALDRVSRANGWTTSQALRECVLRFDEQTTAKPRPRLIGIGMFDGGPADLATNKKYLDDFGLTRAQRARLRKSRRVAS